MEQAMWMLLGAAGGGTLAFIVLVVQVTKMTEALVFVIERVAELIESVDTALLERKSNDNDEDNDEGFGDKWQ